MRRERKNFVGAEGDRLTGEIFGDGPPVLLLHGGGQTRHSWERTALRLAEGGFTAISVDQRGHGESEWNAQGHYSFADFASDAAAIADVVTSLFNKNPICVGASLGGLAALLAEGESAADIFESLILADIAPRSDPAGVARILAFMSAHLERGFGDLQEAADAVASYLPHRPRPPSLDGLAKNLRLDPDGRWRWRWDPNFIMGPRSVSQEPETMASRLEAASRRLRLPVLLARGRESDVIGEAHARDFLTLVPHARLADVGGAAHMVAGDRNDAFADCVLSFLTRREET